MTFTILTEYPVSKRIRLANWNKVIHMRRQWQIYIPVIAQTAFGLAILAGGERTTGSTGWLAQNGVSALAVGVAMLACSVLMGVALRWQRSITTRVIAVFLLTSPTLLRLYATVHYLLFASDTGAEFTIVVFLFAYVALWLLHIDGLIAGAAHEPISGVHSEFRP